MRWSNWNNPSNVKIGPEQGHRKKKVTFWKIEAIPSTFQKIFGRSYHVHNSSGEIRVIVCLFFFCLNKERQE
jgi:hypothetical protein